MAALLAGCTGGSRRSTGSPPTTSASTAGVTTTTTTTPAPAVVDPASVKANELGEVPVLMYHRIEAVPSSEYDRTPADFRAELQSLYDGRYRPVRASDLVSGHLDVPAGTTPVVLTFDDASPGQFAHLPDGRVDPNTAVGILLDFAATHPGFDAVATFYVNRNPFNAGDPKPLFQDLARRGFEFGDHTLTHADLGKLDDAGVQRELVQGLDLITTNLPGAAVATMALPYGSLPKDHALALHGSWGGRSYSFAGAFLVGAAPSPSPFGTGFDPGAIPRIRSSAWDGKTADYGSTFWLDQLARHPERRFVSDGDAAHISFPTALRGRLAPRFADQARPY
jgi:peptidoglycan/xylan/chitin deacetylase (PgdA/CDA1 family)